MDDRNRVIADIPVRKGLEERYCVHVNAASEKGRESWVAERVPKP